MRLVKGFTEMFKTTTLHCSYQSHVICNDSSYFFSSFWLLCTFGNACVGDSCFVEGRSLLSYSLMWLPSRDLKKLMVSPLAAETVFLQCLHLTHLHWSLNVSKQQTRLSFSARAAQVEVYQNTKSIRFAEWDSFICCSTLAGQQFLF